MPTGQLRLATLAEINAFANHSERAN